MNKHFYLLIVILVIAISCGGGGKDTPSTPSISYPIKEASGEYWAYSTRVDGFQKMPKAISESTMYITSSGFWTIRIKNNFNADLNGTIVVNSENNSDCNSVISDFSYAIGTNEIQVVFNLNRRINPLPHTYEMKLNLIVPGVDEDVQGYWNVSIPNSTYNPFGEEKELAYVASSIMYKYTKDKAYENYQPISGSSIDTYCSVAYRNGYVYEKPSGAPVDNNPNIGVYLISGNVMKLVRQGQIEKQTYIMYRPNYNELGF